MTPTRLVVVGEQRSGTTLLARLLDAQGGVRVGIGALSELLPLAMDRGLSMHRRLGPGDRARVADALARGLSANRLQGRVRADDFDTLAEACARALDGFRGDAAIVGTKEHAPAASFAPIVEGLGAHLLYLVRDPRDVILSRARRGDRGLARSLARWRQSVRTALAIEHPRMFIVRYEDLARDVGETFARIADAFDWPLDPARAAAWRLPDGHGTNTSFGVELPTVDARPVERWRAFEADPWVRFAGAWCAPELRRLSYPEGPRVGGLEALAYRARGAAVALRRAGDVKRRAAELTKR